MTQALRAFFSDEETMSSASLYEQFGNMTAVCEINKANSSGNATPHETCASVHHCPHYHHPRQKFPRRACVLEDH